MSEEMKKILAHHAGADKFKYMLLDRMRSDCEYFLGYGNRSTKCLWGESVEGHIEDMKALYNSFEENDKPEWLTMAQIESYEQRMKGE